MKRDAPRSSRVAAKRPDALAGLDLADVDVVIAVCRRQKLFVRAEDHEKSGSGKKPIKSKCNNPYCHRFDSMTTYQASTPFNDTVYIVYLAAIICSRFRFIDRSYHSIHKYTYSFRTYKIKKEHFCRLIISLF